MTTHTQLGAAPTHEYTATMELELARTTAASLHLARSERQLASRIGLALECCAAARQAALIGGLVHLVSQADELAAAIRSAIVVDTLAAAA